MSDGNALGFLPFTIVHGYLGKVGNGFTVHHKSGTKAESVHHRAFKVFKSFFGGGTDDGEIPLIIDDQSFPTGDGIEADALRIAHHNALTVIGVIVAVNAQHAAVLGQGFADGSRLLGLPVACNAGANLACIRHGNIHRHHGGIVPAEGFDADIQGVIVVACIVRQVAFLMGSVGHHFCIPGNGGKILRQGGRGQH